MVVDAGVFCSRAQCFVDKRLCFLWFTVFEKRSGECVAGEDVFARFVFAPCEC
jgi:hypothetical protein